MMEAKTLEVSKVSSRFEGLEVRHVPNNGHDVLSDNPEFVMASVWDFLEQQRVSRS